jgi:hypothetical protein
MVAWMALPLHTPTIAGLPDEAEVTASLTGQNLETGVYIIPWSDSPEDWANPESEYLKRHRSGPLFSIYYRREGGDPMGPTTMLGGLVIDFLAATLAACLLWGAAGGCCNTYPRRVGFVMGLGIFVGIVAHGAYWNWMNFPTDYTIAFIVDVTIGWTLVGLVIASIVRCRSCGEDASEGA